MLFLVKEVAVQSTFFCLRLSSQENLFTCIKKRTVPLRLSQNRIHWKTHRLRLKEKTYRFPTFCPSEKSPLRQKKETISNAVVSDLRVIRDFYDQRNNRFRRQSNNFACGTHFLVHFSAVLHDY